MDNTQTQPTPFLRFAMQVTDIQKVSGGDALNVTFRPQADDNTFEVEGELSVTIDINSPRAKELEKGKVIIWDCWLSKEEAEQYTNELTEHRQHASSAGRGGHQ